MNDKNLNALTQYFMKEVPLSNAVASTMMEYILTHIGSVVVNGYGVRLMGLGMLYSDIDAKGDAVLVMADKLPAHKRDKRYGHRQLKIDISSTLRKALQDNDEYHSGIDGLSERIMRAFFKAFKYTTRYYGQLTLGDLASIRIRKVHGELVFDYELSDKGRTLIHIHHG